MRKKGLGGVQQLNGKKKSVLLPSLDATLSVSEPQQ
jgi:hypothetical protein